MTEVKFQTEPSSTKTLVWFLVISSSIVLLLFYFAFFAVWTPIKGYVSESPVSIPKLPKDTLAEKEVSLLLSQFMASERKMPDTLELSEFQLNHLLRRNKALQTYTSDYHIKLLDSTFMALITTPVSKMQSHMASIVKYLKVEGYLNAELEGTLLLKPQKLELVTIRSKMNNKDAPFHLLGNRTHVDLMSFFEDPYQYQQALKKFQAIKVHQGKLLFIR